MFSSNTFSDCRILLLALLFCASPMPTASAQTGGQRDVRPSTQNQQPLDLVAPAPPPSVRASEAACGGFISQAAPATQFEIVGSDKEHERRVFAQGSFVYLNGGAQQGVSVGQEFSVLRPRGRFSSEFSRKRGPLGVYTQEVGRLRVVRVRDQVSVAEVVSSCDTVLLGDLLRPAVRPAEIVRRPEVPLDIFAEPTGRQTGRIVLARDGREVVSRDNVVFIDLGAEDNMKAGDYLTVYRPKGHGTYVGYGDEMTANARRNYESNELRGGQFSNQAQRLRDVDGSPYGETVKTPRIKNRRPPVPRQVVGEILVIHVEGRTATAIVTRVSQEVFTGDYVELQ